MIDGGYYIKSRKIQDSEISTAPPHVREIWDWLLRECNHTGNKSLSRGQTIRTLRDVQEGLKWFVGYRKEMYSKSKCEMAMNWLRKRGMITTMKTTRGMIITVCNYDYYQNPKNYETNNENNTKPTTNEQSHDTINKNDKNYKKEKNYKTNLLSEIEISDFPELNNDYLQIAKSFHSLFKRNLIEAGSPTNQIDKAKGTWIDDIRLLIETDNATKEGLQKVFEFLKNDEFWRKNIISTSKLRKQYPSLILKIHNNGKNKSSGEKKTRVSDSYKRNVAERILGSNNN